MKQTQQPKQNKEKGGRPPKLDAGIKEIFKKGIELGLSYKDCCEKAGINFSTFCRWRQDIKEFNDLVRTANITMKENCLKSIQVGMIRDWKSAAWKLERRFPDEYKERKEIEISDQKMVVNDLIAIRDDKPKDDTKPIPKNKPKKPDKPDTETDSVFESA